MSLRSSHAFLAALAIGGSASVAASSVLFVDASAGPRGDGSSWTSPLASLDAALAVAANGGVSAVWVREGTYRPTTADSANLRTRRFLVPSGVALVGGFAGTESSPEERVPSAHPTILSGDLAQNDGPNWTNRGDNSYHVVVAPDGSNITLDGLVIRGGYADGATGDLREGAGARFTGGQVSIVGCTFDGNSALVRGGGLHTSGSVLTVSGSTCTTNRATNGTSHGGGIGVSGGSATIDDSVFSGNYIESYGAGVGAGDGGSIAVTNCSFVGNFGRFGAVGSESAAPASCTIANCEFIANQTTVAGYGAAVNATFATLSVAASEFRNNSSTLVGGAIRSFSAIVTLTDCVFIDNTASTTGGTIQADQSTLTVNGCTFAGNSSATGGGALSASGTPGSTTVQDSTFTVNASGDGGAIAVGSEPLSIEGCTFDGNFADLHGGAIATQSNATLSITRSLFRSNVSLNEGGAIRSAGSVATIADSAIIANDAAIGGAIWHSGSALTVLRSTIAANEATVGGGIWKSQNTVTARSSILVANTSAGAGGFAAQVLTNPPGATASTLALNWSCVESLPPLQPGTGNIGADPQFVDLDGSDGIVGTDDDDFSLAPSSLCINRGELSSYVSTQLDLAGAARIQLCRTDMGALETSWPAVAPLDCDGNGVSDECDIATGTTGDCNVNGIPDNCEIAAGAADCDGDGVPDACQFASGGFDCNANGVIDACEIASGAVNDCDHNGVPDSCQLVPAQFTAASPNFTPFGTGFPATFTVAAPPTPVGTVTLTVKARSDLSASNETVTLSLNGTPLATLFQTGGSDCPATPNSATVTVTTTQWAGLVGAGAAQLGMVASPQVSPTQCSDSFISVTISYATASPADLNGDGVVDACAAAGDINGDGIVDGSDLALLLAAWGPCAQCGADINGDGTVDGADLAVLLSNWI